MDGRDLITREEAVLRGCDRRMIGSRECFMCGKKIGRQRAFGWTIFARFGQMLFGHRRCFMKEATGVCRREQKKPVR
jgi:hypothetical protein